MFMNKELRLAWTTHVQLLIATTWAFDDLYLALYCSIPLYHSFYYPAFCHLTMSYFQIHFYQIIAQSKDFVTDVMGDDALQKEGGDALWNSVTHALKPGAIRYVTAYLLSSLLVFSVRMCFNDDVVFSAL
jgi:hypothetical protein